MMSDKTKNRTAGQGNPELVDLNILPDRYRRRRLGPRTVLPWILLLVLLGLLYPVGNNFLQTQQAFRDKQQELDQVQTAFDNYLPVEERLAILEAEIEAAEIKAEEIRAQYSEIDLELTSWSYILFSIVEKLPPGVKVSAYLQSGREIQLQGTADTYQQVLDLEEAMQTINPVHGVQIDSILKLNPEGETESEGSGYVFQLTLFSAEEESQP